MQENNELKTLRELMLKIVETNEQVDVLVNSLIPYDNKDGSQLNRDIIMTHRTL